MTGKRRLVIASGNPGKIDEFKGLLQGRLGAIETPPADFDFPPEPHPTFVENALVKARAVAQATGQRALADDSGICVDALQGRPGVRSARFAAGGDNVELLLERMQGVADRAASFHCVLVLLRDADDPCPLVAHGRWSGAVAETRRGSGGFGYDPVFLLADGRTAAELAPEEKNAVSHRALAVQSLLAQLGEDV